jgi:2',3'-cyclic-nucleotide 2'-phosphodiesterase (5'-nucleotidase family)
MLVSCVSNSTSSVLNSVSGSVSISSIYSERSTSIESFSVPTTGNVDINVFSINDIHGSITDNDYGIAKIGQYIEDNSPSNSLNLTIINGDAFQGGAISNMTKGGVLIDIFNEINISAFVMGNHEFDWELDYLRAYQDGNIVNHEAFFPILGANIIDESTNTLLDFLQPYTIVEGKGLKVGIIGTIGDGLENSIAARMLEGIHFDPVAQIVLSTTRYLREEQDCDIVILSNHNGDTEYGFESFDENFNVISSDPSQKIDLILNGHTHQLYDGIISAKGQTVHVIQSGSNSNYLGHTKFSYNYENKQTSFGSIQNISVNNMGKQSPAILNIIQTQEALLDPILNERLATLKENLLSYSSRTVLATWEANILKKAMGVDVAFVNAGGIRFYSFENNQEIYLKDVIKMMPFDNVAKTVTLTGQKIKQAVGAGYDLVSSSDFSASSLDNNKLYTVCAIDYVFDKDYYPFLGGINPVLTEYLARDLMVEEIRLHRTSGWYPSNTEILLPAR